MEIIVLAVLLVGSNIYWMINTQRLINKLMSTNYRDYTLGTKLGKETEQRIIQKEIVPDDLRPLQEFHFN